MKFRVRVSAHRLSSVLLAAVVMLATSGAFAQATSFKVTHEISKTNPNNVEVTGTVQNETRAEAVDVTVSVQAIGADGKALARGISYVTGRLPAGASATFLAKVPLVAGVASYRATISARFVQGVEGP